MFDIAWFEIVNDGKSVSFVRTEIDPVPYKPFDINAMDVNGDGNDDVIVTTFQEPTIYWYEAPAEAGGLWTKRTLTDNFSGTDIYTGDINGDGTGNIIVSGLFSNKIAWFAQGGDGDGLVWNQKSLDDAVSLPGDISLDDMDGDGDLDVVVAVMGEDRVVWYENKLEEPSCVSVVPESGASGSDEIDVVLEFETGGMLLEATTINAPEVSFACDGITVNSATVNASAHSSSGTVTARITIADDASECSGDVTLRIGDVKTVCEQAFSVTDQAGQDEECLAVRLLGAGSPKLAALRTFRDGFLVRSAAGRKLVDLYYTNQCALKTIIDSRPAVRAVAKRALEALGALVE
ncbi:FG-GAP repeat domain-containing protein [Thermodesulfobacteriota bacterium]